MARKPKSRADGEGSVYYIAARDRWAAAVRQPDGRVRVRTARTRQEAQRSRAAMQRDREAGVQYAPNQTLGAYLADWLETEVKPHKRPRTYAAYEGAIRCHITPALGRLPLAGVTPVHVKRLQSDLARRMAARSANQMIDVLRWALAEAERLRLIADNPASRVRRLAVTEEGHVALTLDQATALVAAAAESRFEPAYLLALLMGLRLGEALGVRWSDLHGGTITIAEQLVRLPRRARPAGAPTVQRAPVKTDSSARTLPVSAGFAAALQRQRVRQAEWRLLAGPRWQAHNLIVTTAVGTMPAEGVVNAGLRHILAAAGLPPRTMHGLRHDYNSLMIATGAHPRTEMALLGHKRVQTTLEIYGHVGADTMATARDSLDRALGLGR